jgi:membrane-associated protein
VLHALAPLLALPALGPSWLDAENLIKSFGSYALIGIAIVVFIETGLLFPLLPGDSLLFTAGLLAAQDQIGTPLWALCLMLFAAAFLGDQTGYLIGRELGPKIFNKPDSRIFKKSHIEQTNAYFDKYGGRTIVIARFVPFVRTYAPVAAGVGRMHYRHFVSYNVIGAFLWGVGVTVLGYFLGQITFIKDNIELILVAIVALSLVPVVIEVLRARRNGKKTQPDGATHAGGTGAAERVAEEDVEG